MVENVVTLNTQAIEFASNGQYPEAIACLKRAISLEKHNYLLWYNLGITYRDAGNLREAKRALLRAHEIETDDDEVIETLALICFNQGCNEEALSYCLEGLAKNAQNAHLWNTIGVIYFNTSEFNLACEAFENAVTINSYYYDALFNLRDTYEELGNKVGYEQCVKQMKNIQLGENSFSGDTSNA
ncbi:MAG: tetratricopeptide repeat protein [Treponema sp.]|nr:tetratricopeptide repeat protein [Treponema sp.]